MTASPSMVANDEDCSIVEEPFREHHYQVVFGRIQYPKIVGKANIVEQEEETVKVYQ